MSRPLGGIATLVLGVASSSGAAPTLPEGGVEIPLLEDRSTYTEEIEYREGVESVKHTLTLYTSTQYTLPETLSDGLTQGLVALIGFNSQDQATVGWSEAAAADRALRLVSCTTSSGEKASSRGVKEWILESIDGTSNI